MKKKSHFNFGLTLLAFMTPPSYAETPLALIYKGVGSCSVDQGDAGRAGYGCSEAAADIVREAGLKYRFVTPTDLPEGASPEQVKAVFAGARVWVQPGGHSVAASKAMSSTLKNSIVDFVKKGGGYVGICAGAFLATTFIGSTENPGLGIFPGLTSPTHYEEVYPGAGYAFLHFNWQGEERRIYFEGGPKFMFGDDVEVVATFSSGDVAAARTYYGKGRVFLSGPHPEAPAVWATEDGQSDPDGSDTDLGAQMVQWAARLTDSVL